MSFDFLLFLISNNGPWADLVLLFCPSFFFFPEHHASHFEAPFTQSFWFIVQMPIAWPTETVPINSDAKHTWGRKMGHCIATVLFPYAFQTGIIVSWLCHIVLLRGEGFYRSGGRIIIVGRWQARVTSSCFPAKWREGGGCSRLLELFALQSWFHQSKSI